MADSHGHSVHTAYELYSDPSMAPSRQESDLTGDRNETQYRLSLESAEAVAAALSARLRPCRYSRGDAAGPPDPGQFITTVYFDTPSRALYQEGLGKVESLRLRARQYYGSADSLRRSPILWLEVKHKLGIRSAKRRIGIPTREVLWFFGAGRITEEMIRIRQRIYGEEAARVLQEMLTICERYREPLQADSIVNFRRVAWQDRKAALRVTLDLDLAVFPPTTDLWTRAFPLIRERLGPPRHVEFSGVVEVKTRGEPPSWLTTMLTAAGAEGRSYSKFEEASRAVHG
jgi:hypothetical protein